MAITTVVTSLNYPQSGSNRTRSAALAEIASFYGGESRPQIVARAGAAWESAIREYNTWLWRFNRVTANITLASPSPAGSDTYDLATDFAEPNRAKLVDSNSKERDSLSWVPFEEWLIYFPDRSATSSRPCFYTAQNVHETGKVTVYPPPATSLQWPTLRLYYFRRIVVPTGDGERLNTPQEIDEGIFQLAQAKMTHKQKSFADAAQEYARAGDFRLGLEHRFRSFPDIPSL
jgi:hypothetical protein